MTYRKASFDEKFYNKSPTITSFLRASEPSCFGPPQAQAHTMPRASGAAHFSFEAFTEIFQHKFKRILNFNEVPFHLRTSKSP